MTIASEESNSAVRKVMKSVLAVNNGKSEDDVFKNLLLKFSLNKVLDITSWILRFYKNCKRSKLSGQLTASDINESRIFFILNRLN